MKILGRIHPPLRDFAAMLVIFALSAVVEALGVIPGSAAIGLGIAGFTYALLTIGVEVWIYWMSKRARRERWLREEIEYDAYIPVARSRHFHRF